MFFVVVYNVWKSFFFKMCFDKHIQTDEIEPIPKTPLETEEFDKVHQNEKSSSRKVSPRRDVSMPFAECFVEASVVISFITRIFIIFICCIRCIFILVLDRSNSSSVQFLGHEAAYSELFHKVMVLH